MAAVGKGALRDPVAVGQENRTRGTIGAQCHRITRQDIGPIGKIRDAPKALGLALGAEHVR